MAWVIAGRSRSPDAVPCIFQQYSRQTFVDRDIAVADPGHRVSLRAADGAAIARGPEAGPGERGQATFGDVV